MAKLFEKYLRSTIVLAIDTITSVAASALVLLFSFELLSHIPGETPFVTTWLIGSFAASLIAFYLTRVYKLVIRFSTLRELSKICMAILVKEAMLAIAVAIFSDALTVRLLAAFLTADFLTSVGGMLLIRVSMLSAYWIIRRRSADEDVKRVLIYGNTEKAVAAYTRLRNSSHYNIVGFLVPENLRQGQDHLLMGKPIKYFSNAEDIKFLRKRLALGGILFVYNADARAEQNRLIPYCQETGVKLYIMPDVDEIRDGKLARGAVRKINIEDLLGRPEIKISMQEIRECFSRKTILVTGAAGSIGSELCRQLATLGVKHLVMFDNAETPLHNVRLEFEERYPSLYFTPVIGDVRHKERLDFVFRKFHPDIVFHAAAYKHVPLMEENPCEAVAVNVRGSRNVADKCVEYGIEKMVMVSTDKAVNPTNIMGCTKRLAEIYVQSLGLAIEKGELQGNTTFVTTRFGNVLGSNGSVIPRFKEQIEKGGPVTVTDPEIRRFFMTIPEACRLVMEAATMATGTQIFVFDMGTPIKIADLAKRMISLAGFEPGVDIAIEYTGLRPGEKLYEEVLATKENTIPTDHDRIFVAKVRDYAYDAACEFTDELYTLSTAVKIDRMVIKMKDIVPEFISKHSPFEKYDKK